MADKKLRVLTAYDEKLIEEIPVNGPGDIELALSTARSLADEPSKRIPVLHRIEILERTMSKVQKKV